MKFKVGDIVIVKDINDFIEKNEFIGRLIIEKILPYDHDNLLVFNGLRYHRINDSYVRLVTPLEKAMK